MTTLSPSFNSITTNNSAGYFRSGLSDLHQCTGYFRSSLTLTRVLKAILILIIVAGSQVKATTLEISDPSSSNQASHSNQAKHSKQRVKTRNMCLYDMMGRNGPISKLMADYQAKSLHWGVRIEFKHYLSDRLAAEDFQSGQCDMVNLPGIRARNFNAFTGSLNAIGAIPDYQHLKIILSALSTAKASKYMRQDAYEVAAIMPTGALYGFVTDRSLDSPEKLVGKKITVLENAPESEYLIKQTGMIPVASSINNAIQKFNSHLVDVTGAPAIAYELMEMHKGLEPSGGIINWPLHQTTMQLVIRWEEFPPDYGQQSRDYLKGFLNESFDHLANYEEKIPSKYWIQVGDDIKSQWVSRHYSSRQYLKEQGIYHASALSLFQKVRCKLTPSLMECTMKQASK